METKCVTLILLDSYLQEGFLDVAEYHQRVKPLSNQDVRYLFCSGGPEYKHSFKDGAHMWALAEARYTNHSLGLAASSRITGLWGMENSVPVGSKGQSSMILCCFCSRMIWSYSAVKPWRSSFLLRPVRWWRLPCSLEGNRGWFPGHGRPVSYYPSWFLTSCSLNSR